MGELWLGLDMWLKAVSQLLSACLWSPKTVEAMVPRAPRPEGVFGLCKASLTAWALRTHAPRFASWALRPHQDDHTTILRKRNRLGAKGMSTRFRSTMDYSSSICPARGAITSR